MLRLFNTLSRRLEPFESLEPPRVGIYACGPTVYDYAHIGNFRFNVWADILRRTLEWLGYEVRLVMNITDVDDRTIEGAARADITLDQYTEPYVRAFFEDLEALGIMPASEYPRATEHVDTMVVLVERLLERGHAYRVNDSVYFRVRSFSDYGKLSRLDPSQLVSADRIEADAYEKEDVRDFALWKARKEGEPAWRTTLGEGRPGWHLECSAMSMEYLGETFDIHAGGVDLMFPHHENEIAQSVAATGKPFARYWLHCAHLIVDGIKMSKSLGNQYTLRDLLDEGYNPVAIRYLLSSVHYRKQLNFTFAALSQAASAVGRLQELVGRLEQEAIGLPEDGDRADVADSLDEARADFRAALEDDLNTSGALGALFSLVRETNAALDRGGLGRTTAKAVLDWIREVDRIWNVLPEPEEQIELDVEVGGSQLAAVGPPVSDEQIELIVRRMRARDERDYDTADELRRRLESDGIELEDTPQGVRWRRVGPPR